MSSNVERRRSRTKSVLSFGGKRSSLLFGKSDLEETHDEKEMHEVKTKANPNKAVLEPEPASWSAEKATIASLRAMDHKDVHGNIIIDPDASNPTRSRMERPLDTIRSFEAAIDHSYSRRPMSAAGPQSSMGPRHGGYNQGPGYAQRSAVDGNGFYARTSSTRPQSYADTNNYMPNQFNPNRRFGQGNRVASDPALYGHNSQGVYPTHGYHQSYDTVGSASVNGSGATDQWGNSTDPSSENSSIDRVQPPPKPDLGEQYGFNGFGGAPQFAGPILEEHGDAPAYGQPGYGQTHAAPGAGFPYQGNDVAPPPPPHNAKQTPPRVPIKLGGASQTVNYDSSPPSPEGKRKSWIKRRFSKGSR